MIRQRRCIPRSMHDADDHHSFGQWTIVNDIGVMECCPEARRQLFATRTRKGEVSQRLECRLYSSDESRRGLF